MNHSDNRSVMVTVSFVLALVAFASFQIFFISLPCASVSIILALISRGDGPLVPRAKAALACASAAAVLTTVLTMSAVYTYMHNPQLRAEVEQLYQYYTDPDAENGSTDASSKSGEALLREILSGQYRADKQSGTSSDTAPSGTDPQSANEVSATLNGGRVI